MLELPSFRERHELVVNEIRKEEENVRMTTAAVGQAQHHAPWETMQERRMACSELWRAEPARISFMLRAVYDLLPIPANLAQ